MSASTSNHEGAVAFYECSQWTIVHGSSNPAALCPDLLRYEQIGEADGWRGHVVRGFFWLLRVWPVRGR